MSLNPRLAAKLERQAERERRMSMEDRRSLAGLLPEGAALFDEPMSRHSSSGVGGAAEALVEVASADELKSVIAWAAERSVDYRFWGMGSATIIRDGGISGALIKLGHAFDFARVESSDAGDIVVSAGGAVRARALAWMLAAQGAEDAGFLLNFAGTLGGALCSRRDEKEAQISKFVEEATIVTREGRELTLRKQALRFENGRLKIPRTAAVIKALLKFRRAGKCSDETRTEARTEGACDRRITRVFSSAARTDPGVLIEEAGLSGVRVGGARIASEDANSIVNEKEASARDMAVLINLVRDRVREASGVSLDPLIEIAGDR